jgi:hypothetical protein
LTTVLTGLGEVDNCGDVDFAPVTGAVPARSPGTSRPGGISFWGDFTATVRHDPNRPAPAFRIAVTGGRNQELCPFLIPPFLNQVFERWNSKLLYKKIAVLKILPRLAVEYFEKLSQRLPQALANRLLAQMAVRFQKAERSPSSYFIAAHLPPTT